MWAPDSALLAADDDALLVQDLLSLFAETEDAPPPPVSPASSCTSSALSSSDAAPLPPTKAKTVSRKRPMKLTLDGLRVETQQLTAQLDMLRRDTIPTAEGDVASLHKEAALTARFKRRKAELTRQQLRDALAANALFIRGLQASVLSAPPAFATGANLCLQLHNYTRLPNDRTLRWQELAAMGQELQMRRAMEIVERETHVLTASDEYYDGSALMPRIGVHETSSRNGFCVTTTSTFAVDTKDVGAVLRGACFAVVASASKCRSYACTTSKQLAVDLEASAVVPNMFYRVTGVRQRGPRDAHDEALLLESRTVTMYKQTEDFAVLLWDYVDEDAQNPTDDAADISRQTIGMYLIRREMCADGVERCVCRTMNTRRYHFLPRCSRESLESYERASAPREHELLVHGLLLDAVKNEERLCVSAV